MIAQLDTILWISGALMAVTCLIVMANRRRRHLEALVNDYIQRQVLLGATQKESSGAQVSQDQWQRRNDQPAFHLGMNRCFHETVTPKNGN